MPFRRSLSLLFAISLCIGPLLAAETVRIMSWRDAVRTAAEKNPDLLAARESKEGSRADYKESFNEVMPQLSLTNSYGRFKGDNAQTKYWSARGTASMTIFDPATYAGIFSSRYQFEQSRASLRSVSANVLLDLHSSFATLLYQQHLIDVSTAILKIRRNNAGLVGLRYDSGRESKGNKLRTSAELLEAESDLNQARRDLKVRQQEFKRRLGDDSMSVVVATGSLNVAYTANEEPNIDSYVESNPTVEFRKAQLKSAQADLDQARGVLWPNVSASYSRSLQGRDYFPDEDPNWTASAVISLPIFGGGPTSAFYSITSARRGREEAEETLRSTRYQVRTDLETTWSDLSGALEQVQVQKAFLEAARQRNDEADIRYRNGLMSYEDWEKIVADRVNFERSVILAERNAVVAQANWDNARGIELETQLASTQGEVK